MDNQSGPLGDFDSNIQSAKEHSDTLGAPDRRRSNFREAYVLAGRLVKRRGADALVFARELEAECRATDSEDNRAFWRQVVEITDVLVRGTSEPQHDAAARH